MGPLGAKVSILRFPGNGVQGFGVPDVSNWRRVGAAYLRARLAQGMDEDSVGLFHGGVSSNSGAGSRTRSEKVEQCCSNCSPRAQGGQSITCHARNIGKCSSESDRWAGRMPGGVVCCIHSELGTQWLLEAVVLPPEVPQTPPREKTELC